MRTQLVRIGSSLGIIIDRPILDMLKVADDTEFDVSVDGDALILPPLRVVEDTAAEQAYKRVARRHRDSLKKLAD